MILRHNPKNQRSCTATVWLNGVVVSAVVLADDENGFVYRVKEAVQPPVENGNAIYLRPPFQKDDKTGDFPLEMLSGQVEIELREA